MPQSNGGEKTFPLSISQKNIWNVEQVHKGTSINNICSTIYIKGRIDMAAIQKTLNLVIEADQSLRTQIDLVDGTPVQFHAPYAPEQFPIFDFSLTNQEGITHWENAVTREVMPLYRHPLYYFAVFKSGESDGGILMKTHHIITDGWSQALLGNRISETYLALLQGKEPELEPLDSYLVHVNKEQEYLASRACQKDRAYWEEKMAQFQEPCALKECKSAIVSPVGQRKTYQLSEVLNHAIGNFCTANRVAPFAVFYMALAIYLRRISGLEQLGIGVPIFNRINFKEKKITGMFVSTLPFLNHLDENWSLEEFTEHLNDEWFDLLRHQKYPFGDIMSLAKKKHPDLDHLFHLVLSYQNSRLFQTKDASAFFTGRWHYSGYQSEHLVIHLSSWESEHKYSVDYDYLTQIFSAEEIDCFHHYLMKILKEALDHPKKPIWQLSVLSGGEEEKVLFSFNQTAQPLMDQTISKKLSACVKEHPDRVALIFHGRRMSYRELYENARRYAYSIECACPGGGKIVAVSLEKGFSLVQAMLGAALSGNAWVIIPASLPKDRKKDILLDSSAALLISEKSLEPSVPLLTPGGITGECPEDYQIRKAEGNDLAYLVYTSGSTGKPKGVEIEQRSLLNFAMGMAPLYGYGGVLSLCSVGFDVFVLESVVSLLNGRTVILASQEEQESPSALASLIRSYAVGVIAITPSRLKAYMNHPEFLRALKQIESFICGGEHLSGELIQLLKLHSRGRIYNQYGPSEATIGVSYQLMNDSPVITIGAPMPNCRLYILDSHLQPLPIGVYGDLYVGGLCVGRGYHNAPELTEQSFLESPFEPGERIYRTGDVACWNQQGRLLLGGRKDSQIKLRGLRIEPQEIAMCLMAHPQVETAAVRVIGEGERRYLAAYYTSKTNVPEVDLISFAVTCLPDYMIPAYLTRIDEMPLSPSGKIDYSRLPDPVVSAGGERAKTDTQRRLLEIFQRVLNNREIDVQSDYFLAGGDSLNAMETLCQIEQEFGVTLKIVDLYAFRNVVRLEQRLKREGESAEFSGAKAFVIPKAPRLSLYPLTPSQQSLYFQSQMDPTSLAYNMPGVFRFGKQPDISRLTSALKKLVREEALFRTAFVMENGKIGQKVLKDVLFDVERLQAGTFEEAKRAFLRPFNLAAAPLFRAALWREESGEQLLFIDMHHLVSDGISTPLLMKRLDALYRGQEPELPEISFQDYAYWLQNRDSKTVAGEESYWKERMEGAGELLDLPVDKQRPKTFDYQGENVVFSLEEKTAVLCAEFCKKEDYSPYMLFAAAFAVLLSKYTGSSDIIIGTPVSGRREQELWNVLGPFLNTLPLRLAPQKELTDREFLQQVKNTVLAMLDNQDVSLEDILSLAHVKRSAGQAALYNVMFSYRPMEEEAFFLDGEPVSCAPLETGTAKMDLNLEAYKTKNGYSFRLEYATSLYYRDSMELLSRCFCAVVEELIKGQEKTLYELPAVSFRDRLELLERPNRMHTPYLKLCVDQAVDQMAELIPEAPAIRSHGVVTTYGELKKRSDALAGQLQRSGARKGDFIGLSGRRDSDLVAGMLGILKAGCAYVPVLSSFPEARLRYMLEISGAKLLLCDPCTYPELPDELPCPKLVMTREETPFTPVEGRSVEDDIHILFTSGTTGQPKGAVLPHRAIMNLLTNVERMFETAQGDILCASGVIFDTFITETLLAFCMGKCAVMADEEEMMLPWRIAELIENNGVEIIQLTPSRLQMCLGTEAFVKILPRIKVLFSCGEVLTRQLLDSLKEAGAQKIFNLYGPTETAVYITGIDMTHRDKIVVGKAFTNCRLYVLDENLKPVMPMARGELYIGGECLSRGYVNRPDLTKEAYLPDPFFPGEIMYKSGDIVRLMPDRGVEFVGRRDLQVKLNGQRIELDEITGQIIQSGQVGEAAVIAVRKPDFSMELRAFVTPRSEESQVDLEKIKKYLRTQLPSYMVPSSFSVVTEIPKTATGKNDRRALARLETEAPSQKGQDKPEKLTVEQQVVKIWQEVLDRKQLDLYASFFDQGGTSLAALTVLSRYFQLNWSMTLAQFYEHAAIREQIAILKDAALEQTEKAREVFGQTALTRERATLEAPDGRQGFNPPNVLNVQNQTAESRFPEAKDSILVTGATGFLGAHLVKELLDAGERSLLCLVRGGSQERLWETLSGYFGAGWVEGCKDRVKAFGGDITQDRLGLPPDAYQGLSRCVKQVVHAAADVRHYAAGEESLRTNVRGTENVIAFAAAANAKLIHISTASVSGEYLVNAPDRCAVFSEDDFDIGQNWQENIYVKGKFLAEQKVRKGIEAGLDAKIFRVGRLVGRSTDGVFQKNPETNAFYRLLQGLLKLDAIPASVMNEPVELTAVDLCAKGVVALRNGVRTVYHLFNPNTIPLRELLRNLNHAAQPIGDLQFEQLLKQYSAGAEQELASSVETWNQKKIHGQKIYPTAEFTVQELSGHGIVWSYPNAAVLLRAFL